VFVMDGVAMFAMVCYMRWSLEELCKYGVVSTGG